MSALLEVDDLTVRFAPEGADRAAAVDGVSLSVASGETLGLLGSSGSGKTTLARALLRLLPGSARLSGAVLFRGRNLMTLGERDLSQIRGAGIAMVFQEPALSLSPFRRVCDQVADVLAAHRGGAPREHRDEAVAALGEFGLNERGAVRAFPHELSGGQRQRVAIAIAVAARPALLVADEPTSTLDPVHQAQVIALLKQLVEQRGMALLLASHDAGVLGALCNRVAVMASGRVVEEGPAKEVLSSPRHPETRRLLTVAIPLRPRAPGSPSDAVVDARDVRLTYVRRGGLLKRGSRVRAVDGVTLSIARGSTFALVGASGSGKSSLARCLVGLEKPSSGQVRLDGEEAFRLSGPRLTAFRRRAQMVLQDAATTLNPRFPASEIVEEPLRVQRLGTPEERRALALELMERVHLDPAWADRLPSAFSGGQRQRLSLARALALEPKLLVLDEAFSGLDRAVQARILELVANLRDRLNLTLLLVSHDLGLVGRLADEVAVMHEGRVVERGPMERILREPAQPQTRALVAAILPAPELAAP